MIKYVVLQCVAFGTINSHLLVHTLLKIGCPSGYNQTVIWYGSARYLEISSGVISSHDIQNYPIFTDSELMKINYQEFVKMREN